MRIDGARDHAALIALGAFKVQDVHGEQGEVVGVDVDPEIDIAGYAAALAQKQKADLIAYAERRRWEIEVGGIDVGGIAVATDEESQRKILGAYVAATRNSAWSTLWGSVHPVDAEAMIAIGDQVQAHINASFVARGAVFAAIEAGEITTLAAIDSAFSA